MLTSLAFIFLLGMFLSWCFKKVKLPGLLGMLATGILLGPYAFQLLDPSILSISADLRQIALIIILTRAGLSLDIQDLKQVGRPAVLMCFLPACFEIGGMMLLAPLLLPVTLTEAAVMGAVVAAVSPAVIVPKMLGLMEKGLGVKEGIPQMILAGASVDDVFVIVLFTIFTGIAQGGRFSAANLIQIPVSVLTGIGAGLLAGFLMSLFFKKFHMRDSAKVVVLLSVSFLMMTLENRLKGTVPFSGLLAVMSIGLALQKKRADAAARLAAKYSKLWVGAEVLLFVLVGAMVDIRFALEAGAAVVALIFGVLLFRVAGVWCCLLKTRLNWKERIFCMIAYLPKATVQAAMGGVPLAMGLSCGKLVLTVAVASILITAPLGAVGIERTAHRLLRREGSD